MLKKNPVVAVEVVLARLHQKIEEWQSDKRKMTDIWQKMYDANYHKSLDHRSFYFKQVSGITCTQATHANLRSARDPLWACPRAPSFCSSTCSQSILVSRAAGGCGAVKPLEAWSELPRFCVCADGQAESGPEDHDAGDQGHRGQAAAGGHRRPPGLHQLLRQTHPRPHLQLQGQVRTPSSA